MLHSVLFLTYVPWYISQNELHSFKKSFDPVQDISFYTSCLEMLALKWSQVSFEVDTGLEINCWN